LLGLRAKNQGKKDALLSDCQFESELLFRRVNKVGRTWGDGMTVKAVCHIVKESVRSIGVAKLRATCTRQKICNLGHCGRCLRRRLLCADSNAAGSRKRNQHRSFSK